MDSIQSPPNLIFIILLNDYLLLVLESSPLLLYDIIGSVTHYLSTQNSILKSLKSLQPNPTQINRLSSLNLQHMSSFELLFSRISDYKHLKVFGCACYSLLKPYKTHKLQPKTSKCVFVGYPLEYKGYLC